MKQSAIKPVQVSKRNSVLLKPLTLKNLDEFDQATTEGTRPETPVDSFDAETISHESTVSSPFPKTRKNAFSFQDESTPKTSVIKLEKSRGEKAIEKKRAEPGDKGIIPISHRTMKVDLQGAPYLKMEVKVDKRLEFDLELKDVKLNRVVDPCHSSLVQELGSSNLFSIHLSFPRESDYTFTVLGKKHGDGIFSKRLTYFIKNTGKSAEAKTGAAYGLRCLPLSHHSKEIKNPGKQLTLSFRIPHEVHLLVDFRFDNKEKVPNNPIFQYGDDEKLDILFHFPRNGGYNLQIHAQGYGKMYYRKVFDYKIIGAEVTSQTFQPPKVFAPMNEFPNSLYSPLTWSLDRDTLVKFHLKIKDAVVVKVAGERTLGYLEKIEEDTFQGYLPISNSVLGSVYILAKFYERAEDFITIAEYFIEGEYLVEDDLTDSNKLNRSKAMLRKFVRPTIEKQVDQVKEALRMPNIFSPFGQSGEQLYEPTVYFLDKNRSYNFKLRFPKAQEICVNYDSNWIKLTRSSEGIFEGEVFIKEKAGETLKVFAKIGSNTGCYEKIIDYKLV